MREYKGEYKGWIRSHAPHPYTRPLLPHHVAGKSTMAQSRGRHHPVPGVQTYKYGQVRAHCALEARNWTSPPCSPRCICFRPTKFRCSHCPNEASTAACVRAWRGLCALLTLFEAPRSVRSWRRRVPAACAGARAPRGDLQHNVGNH